MISRERVKTAFRVHSDVRHATLSCVYTEDELDVIATVFRTCAYFNERLATESFDALQKAYEYGCRTKAQYVQVVPPMTEEQSGIEGFNLYHLARIVHHDMLNGDDTLLSIRNYMFEHFDSMFNDEIFDETREKTDVRRRH